MEFVTENEEEYILINKQGHLDELLTQIFDPKPFANKFKFSDRVFFVSLLDSLKINYDDFTVKYFFYDSIKKIHISESEFGYVWISTFGLVPTGKTTTNRLVNACLSQYLVVSLLFKEAIRLVKDERVYEVDSYSSGQLTKLSPAIFHNLTFFIEVFCKAYLSLTKEESPFTHSLSKLYQKTVEIMNREKHNDSLFQILILDPLYKFVDHINRAPEEFKEHNIKYDGNLTDDSVILFDYNGLIEMTYILEYSVDFISDYFYRDTETDYLETNVYQKMLEMADTEDKKQKIKEMYPHLAKSK